MAHSLFKVNHQNPNVRDGACLCNQHSKMVDCKPPYIVFFASDMWNPRSPTPVMCASCVGTACKRLMDAGADFSPEIEEALTDFDAAEDFPPLDAQGSHTDPDLEEPAPPPVKPRKLSRAEVDAMTIAGIEPPVNPDRPRK